MSDTKTTVIGVTTMSLALIGCVTFLTWKGEINGQAAIAFFTTLLTAVVAAIIGHVATKTGASAALKTPQQNGNDGA